MRTHTTTRDVRVVTGNSSFLVLEGMRVFVKQVDEERNKVLLNFGGRTTEWLHKSWLERNTKECESVAIKTIDRMAERMTDAKGSRLDDSYDWDYRYESKRSALLREHVKRLEDLLSRAVNVLDLEYAGNFREQGLYDDICEVLELDK